MKAKESKIWLYPAFIFVLSVFLSVAAQAAPKSVNKNAFLSTSKPKVKRDESLTQDLIYRVAFGRAEDVKLLLDKNADPDARNDSNIPILVIASIRTDDEAPKIVKSILDHGGNINILGPQNNVPVLEAVRSGRLDVLQILIDYKALLGNIRDETGRDLLTIAQRRGDPQIVDSLNAGLDAEKDKIKSLRSQENFMAMVQNYSYLNCANEYLNYYISRKPDEVDPIKFDKVISQNAEDINELVSQIKMIFAMTDKDLKKVRIDAKRNVINGMNILLSDKNREYNGVGTDEDLDKRCTMIAKRWNLNRLKKIEVE